MVVADLDRLFRATLENLAQASGYNLTPDDFNRFDEIIAEYGGEIVIEALNRLLDESELVFPSLAMVRATIVQNAH